MEHSADVIDALPDDRTYETAPAQRLDETLLAAIDAAEDIGNEMLICVLRFELACHHLKHGTENQ